MSSNVTLNCSNQLWQPVLASGFGLPGVLVPSLAHVAGNEHGCGQRGDKAYGRC